MKIISGILGMLLMFSSAQVFAWGGRGHATICEAAVFLVNDPGLKYFVTTRPHIMGHICNIPDTYWKGLSPEVRKVGDPTHYFNPEKLGLKLEEIPADFNKIVDQYTGKASKENESVTLSSVPEEVGSAWWRADQFYKRALEGAKKAKTGTVPKNFKEMQDNKSPYNEGTYEMMVNMGLMGHFIGDMGQPFHNTSDHDGFAAGHGGIHSYYEEEVVSCFDGDMMSKIIKEAKAMKKPKFIGQKSVVEDLRALSLVTYSEIKDVLKADKMISPSSLTVDKGVSSKKYAERKPPCENSKNFEKMIIRQMARSSLLLARLWEQMYQEAGSPQVEEYGSYRFPFTPDFVQPDYYPQKETK
jgi:hypothetical protein